MTTPDSETASTGLPVAAYVGVGGSNPGSDHDARHRRIHQHLAEAKQISEQLAELGLAKTRNVPKLSPIAEMTSSSSSAAQKSRADDGGASDSAAPPLSPISEAAVSKTSSSVAVSDESVAGDSGVFEAVTRSTHVVSGLGHVPGAAGVSFGGLETAQVQVKLRYAVEDAVLHVGIEKARNLAALFIPENRKM